MKLGQFFQREPVRNAEGLTRAWERRGLIEGATPVFTAGLVAGTQVATAIGWRIVEAVQEGDKVLTFDDGLQTVRRVERRFVEVGRRATDVPLHVPAGALGNREAMLLLPDQPVMVESDLGEAMFGDPFTLVPAHALTGFKGIAPDADAEVFEVISIYFDSEQVVFGNVGALFFCPAAESVDLLDAAAESYTPGYEVLSPDQALRFVAAMRDEAQLDSAWEQVERDFCAA
ncbi:Hint domain-containing protein [Celeribacter sp.]|uniref:Hint domain-containing protein n=1 Tax=Celeribacter sp. TaxID=1890673 RepID=UPI003A910525